MHCIVNRKWLWTQPRSTCLHVDSKQHWLSHIGIHIVSLSFSSHTHTHTHTLLSYVQYLPVLLSVPLRQKYLSKITSQFPAIKWTQALILPSSEEELSVREYLQVKTLVEQMCLSLEFIVGPVVIWWNWCWRLSDMSRVSLNDPTWLIKKKYSKDDIYTAVN